MLNLGQPDNLTPFAEKPARRRWREKEGWLGRDQGGEEKRGGERQREGGGWREGFPPQLVASLFSAELSRCFIKRAPRKKIKLKMDVASKHPAQACASPPSPPSPPPPPPLGSAALTSIGSYCTSRASWQRPIVFPPFIPSSSPPHHLLSSPSLQPQNRAWAWSTVIVIPKTNWPSFNSTDKCKKLEPHKSQDV